MTGFGIQLQLGVTLTGVLRQAGAAKNMKIIFPHTLIRGSKHLWNILCQQSVSSSWVCPVTMALCQFLTCRAATPLFAPPLGLCCFCLKAVEKPILQRLWGKALIS